MMSVYKLRLIHLIGTMVLCNGFRIGERPAILVDFFVFVCYRMQVERSTCRCSCRGQLVDTERHL